MWSNRYDDLWLWPMPPWFVRGCNRVGGTLVLDATSVLLVIGLAATIGGTYFRLPAVYWLGIAALVPTWVFIAVLVGYGIWRLAKELVVGPPKTDEASSEPRGE